MGRFYDFDAARAERCQSEAPTMLVFGELVELPRSVPAAIPLRVAATPDLMVTTALLVDLLGLIVGPERVNAWVTEHNLEQDDIRDLYYGALRVIQERDEDEADPEGQPPATGDPDGETSPSTGGQ